MIKSVVAREILASNGYPTIETKVTLASGAIGVASVPYGSSAGTYEAKVLLDGDKDRFNGKGALKAMKNVNDILAPVVIGKDHSDQRAIDKAMIDLDGTPDKANLGGNSILSVSLAVAKAAAAEKKIELYQHIIDTFGLPSVSSLPMPMAVAIEGGKHADETTDLQEFCFITPNEKSPRLAIEKVLSAYHQLEIVLKEQKLSTNVGSEGAFAPNGISSNEAPLQYMVEAMKRAKLIPHEEIGVYIDAAASEFYNEGKYYLKLEGKSFTSDELITYYEPWLSKYPIIAIEDMLHEDDWSSWSNLTALASSKGVLNIGDDLTVTNMTRLQEAIDTKAISGILIKLNQIGSLTETVDCCMLAREHDMITLPSHRGGGETTDTSMIDLAVAVGSKYIKVGPTRGERVVKYNRLMEIEAMQ